MIFPAGSIMDNVILEPGVASAIFPEIIIFSPRE